MSEIRSAKHGNALRLQLVDDLTTIDPCAWTRCVMRQRTPTPPSCATPTWQPCTAAAPPCPKRVDAALVLLWHGPEDNAELVAACPLYLKAHSYGEYVFDWAWANAMPSTACAITPRRWWRCRSRRCPVRVRWRAIRRRARRWWAR